VTGHAHAALVHSADDVQRLAVRVERAVPFACSFDRGVTAPDRAAAAPSGIPDHQRAHLAPSRPTQVPRQGCGMAIRGHSRSAVVRLT
jgi:hypothetical protein